jgi:hypothetical protein
MSEVQDFRMSELDKMAGKEEPVIAPEPAITPEEPIVPEPVVPVAEPVAEPVVEPEPVTTPEPKKVEIDIYEFLKTNQDTVLKVLTEKGKDYSSLSNEDALRIKLQKDNPEWDSSDVEAELQDKYAVGLQKIEIDQDSMTDDEIKEAKLHNKKIDASIRSLKKDGKEAVSYLSSQYTDLELPKFEYQFEDEGSQEQAKPEEILQQYTQQLTEQAQKQKEEQWIPQLKEAFTSVDSIKEEVKYVDGENEVVLNVNYKLSEQEKTEVLGQLSDYISQPSDEKYFIKDGEGNTTGVDVQRFVQEKSEELLRKKIYKTIAKEAAAKAREDLIKNKVVNYSEEARNHTPSAHSSDNDFENFMLKR